MNYLAHLCLSGRDEELMVGNFIADEVRGKQFWERYRAGIARGIALHRAIDSFTDNHPLHHQCRKRLYEKHHHYSGVVVDIYFDHLLTRQWATFNNAQLTEFVTSCFQTLTTYKKELPETMQFMLEKMIKYNWLMSYQSFEGLQKAFEGMARRAAYPSRMNEAVEDLKLHYELYQEDFANFFPVLQQFVSDWLKEN